MNLLKALLAYGVRKQLTDTRIDVDFSYKLTISATKPPTLEPVESTYKTRFYETSSNTFPQDFFGKSNYVLEEGKKFTAFWEKCFRLAAKDKKVLATLKSLDLKAIQKLRSVVKKDGLIAIHLGTDREPILARDAIVAAADAEYEAIAKEKGVCFITGSASVLANSNLSVPLAGSSHKTPIVTHNQATAEYRGLEQGDNFPIGYETQVYISLALRSLADTNGAVVRVFGRDGMVKKEKSNTTIIIWSDDDRCAAFSKVLTGFQPGNSLYQANSSLSQEEQAVAWAEVESFKGSTEVAHVLVMRGGGGRNSVLHYSEEPLSQLASNCLDFRSSWGNGAMFSHFGRAASLAPMATQVEVILSILLGRGRASTEGSGGKVPLTFRRGLLPFLAMIENPHKVDFHHPSRLAIKWLQFSEGRLNRMVFDGSVAPIESDYIRDDKGFYAMGRMVYLLTDLHASTLAVRKDFGFVHTLMRSPSTFAEQFSKKFDNCQETARRKGLKRPQISEIKYLMSKVGDDFSRQEPYAPWSPWERQNYLEGYRAQEAYSWAQSKHRTFLKNQKEGIK